MQYIRLLISGAVVTMFFIGLVALADEDSKKGLEALDQLGWFSASAPIQDLRERSTETFNFLDEDDSGSITLEEIDFTQLESDMETMDRGELQQNRRRIRAIQQKFLNWHTEIDEFEVVDTNQDGSWNKDEYLARSDVLNLHRLEIGIQQWDTDGNSAIELHEFNSHLDELELLDEDGDGTVSREEAFKSKNSQVITDVLLQQLNPEAIILGGNKALDELSDTALPSGPGVRIIHRTSVKEESN